jgi:PAS domain S-box-containing protein
MKDDLLRRHVPQTAELISLGVALAAVILIGVLSYQATSAAKQQNAQLRLSRNIDLTSGNLFSALKDAETGQRGYLITGRPEYLEPYNRAVAEVPQLYSQLVDAVRERPDQAARVAAVQPLITQKLEELDRTIELKKSGDDRAAIEFVNTDAGKRTMDQIRRIIEEIQEVSAARSSQQASQVESTQQRAEIVTGLGSILLLGLLIFATITIRRGTEQRHRLIEALQTSEQEAIEVRDWLQTTLASIGDAVIATDGEGRVDFLNPVAEKLTGWPQKDAKGVPLEKVFVIHNEETGAVAENPVAKALRMGSIVGLANHTVLTSRDGRKYAIDDSAAPIRNSAGQVFGVVMVFRDITDLRAIERERERTQIALANANSDLQRFAFAASHDLREPLRTVKVFSELLENSAPQLNENHRKQLDFIVKGVSRMEQLVDGLLAYSIAGSPQGHTLRKSCLEDVLAQTLENLSAAIAESQAVVTHDPLPAIVCEPLHIGQVFQNLISNAIKYSRDEPPRVHVSAKDGNREWVFSVSDNGTGIRPEYFGSVFEIFKRLHGQDRPGSGIGLATCRQIVERYQGRIWVDSEVGKGSTFYFSLPRTDV